MDTLPEMRCHGVGHDAAAARLAISLKTDRQSGSLSGAYRSRHKAVTGNTIQTIQRRVENGRQRISQVEFFGNDQRTD